MKGQISTLSTLSIKDDRRALESYYHHSHTGPTHMEWAASKGPRRRNEEIRDSEARLAARRNSDTDSESHPHRPW